MQRRRTKEHYNGEMKFVMDQNRNKTLHDDFEDSNIDLRPFGG